MVSLSLFCSYLHDQKNIPGEIADLGMLHAHHTVSAAGDDPRGCRIGGAHFDDRMTKEDKPQKKDKV